MVSGVIIDPDEGTYLDYRHQARKDFLADGIVDMRAIISDRNTIAISWLFGIAEELMTHCSGRIIQCNAGAYVTGFHEVRLVLDKSRDPIILPPVTPAEHFRVIVHPLATGETYDTYLRECKEAFHIHRVFGITGMASHNQANGNGMDYCIRIADELIRSEDAVVFVSSGWVFGPGQYALDIVLIRQDTAMTHIVPGWSRNWNFHSRCKLQRMPLLP